MKSFGHQAPRHAQPPSVGEGIHDLGRALDKDVVLDLFLDACELTDLQHDEAPLALSDGVAAGASICTSPCNVWAWVCTASRASVAQSE